MINQKEYLPQQLALRNGQDKEEVWVAYKGKIYDMTESGMWSNGQHYEHWAGQDLTDELGDAPHNERVFEKFDVIGVLAGSGSTTDSHSSQGATGDDATTPNPIKKRKK